jgi:hypothetical protein
VREELLRRVLLDDAAVVHEDHAVGGAPGEAHLVGDDDHGHAVSGEVGHDVEDLVDHLRVERRGRLVEEHHGRVHRQRPGDGDALLLPAGQLRGVLVGLAGDADPLEQLAAARSASGLLDALDLDRPSVTFSSTVLWANRLKDWKTIPTFAAAGPAACPRRAAAARRSVIVPASMVSSRLMVRHSVLLPEPDGR